MRSCATAEQVLKDSHPRVLRAAFLAALLLHIAAFVAVRDLSFRPYAMSSAGPPPIRPVEFVIERPRPEPEAKKEPEVTEFVPTEDADPGATIGSNELDPVDVTAPALEERARRDSFRAFDVPPVLVMRTEPAYPDLARQAELEGSVGLLIVIDELGNVERADVVKSVPGLDGAAVEAVLKWKFEPARQRDVPVRVRVFQMVHFRLRG